MNYEFPLPELPAVMHGTRLERRRSRPNDGRTINPDGTSDLRSAKAGQS